VNILIACCAGEAEAAVNAGSISWAERLTAVAAIAVMNGSVFMFVAPFYGPTRSTPALQNIFCFFK
jgi:hypothetical protein